VISARGQADMEATLGGIPGLILAAELGYLQYSPARPGEPRQWRRTVRDQIVNDVQWREAVTPELTWYTMRTNGAYLKWQESAVQWCYHDADPDFGRFQARQLTNALRTKLQNTGVSVVHSLVKGLVEVRLAAVNKGVAADSLFTEASAVAPVDFTLCIGADDADEFMLSAMMARILSSEMRDRLQRRAFAVTVGHRETSHAQYQFSDAREVVALLETLCGNSSGAFVGTRR